MLSTVYLLLLLVPLLSVPPGVPWTVDDGCKWILATEGEGGLRGALPYLGRELDPELRFVSIAPPFARVVEDRLVSQYPLAFPLLSRPLLRVLGPLGGYLLPVLGALAAAWGAARLAELWKEGGGGPSRTAQPPATTAGLWAWLFAGPLGPLAWYGTTFWEHTVTAALVVWGVVFLVRSGHRERGLPGDVRFAVLAAVLLALATWIREETVLFVIVLAVTVFFARERPSSRALWGAGAAYVLLAAPIFPWLAWTTGSWTGFHVQGNISGSLPAAIVEDRASIVRGLLWSGDEGASEAGDLALTLVAALLVVVAARLRSSRLRSLGFTLAGAAVGVVAMVVIFSLEREADMPMTLIRTSGLLLFAPWVVWTAGWRWRQGTRLALSVPIVILLFFLATPEVTAYGLHWGPRILLSTIPLLAALAGLGFGRGLALTASRSLRIAAVVLALGCFALQGYGTFVQVEVRRGHAEALARTRTFLAAGEEAPLVTHLWWYAPTFAALYVERPIFKVRSQGELSTWLARFVRAGGQRFYWTTAAPHDEILAGLPVRVERSERLEDGPRGYRHRILEVIVEADSP